MATKNLTGDEFPKSEFNQTGDQRDYGQRFSYSLCFGSHLKIPETGQREVEEERDGQEEEAEEAADGVRQAEGLVEVPEIGRGAAAAFQSSKL